MAETHPGQRRVYSRGVPTTSRIDCNQQMTENTTDDTKKIRRSFTLFSKGDSFNVAKDVVAVMIKHQSIPAVNIALRRFGDQIIFKER